jgi:hypothetical protein
MLSFTTQNINNSPVNLSSNAQISVSIFQKITNNVKTHLKLTSNTHTSVGIPKSDFMKGRKSRRPWDCGTILTAAEGYSYVFVHFSAVILTFSVTLPMLLVNPSNHLIWEPLLLALSDRCLFSLFHDTTLSTGYIYLYDPCDPSAKQVLRCGMDIPWAFPMSVSYQRLSH